MRDNPKQKNIKQNESLLFLLGPSTEAMLQPCGILGEFLGSCPNGILCQHAVVCLGVTGNSRVLLQSTFNTLLCKLDETSMLCGCACGECTQLHAPQIQSTLQMFVCESDIHGVG